MRKRSACPKPSSPTKPSEDGGKEQTKNGKDFEKDDEVYEESKKSDVTYGGYLVGRHPECGE